MSSISGGGRVLVVLALVVGLAGGLTLAFLLGRSGADSQATTGAAAGDRPGDGDPEALAELPEPDPVGDPNDPGDPEAALRGFLAAEAAGEWETSYGYLTDALRETLYTSAAAWVRSHADFPRVTAYRIDEVIVEEDAGRASARTLTGFEATIDPVLGLVASRGRTDWTLERDDAGRWRVDTNETRNQPLYPAADEAEAIARRWVAARARCETTTDLETGLVGTRALADRLCDEGAEMVEIGELTLLRDSAESAALLSEFGPEVFSWARTVVVRAASPFTLVLGPVGEEWRVVAVLNQS